MSTEGGDDRLVVSITDFVFDRPTNTVSVRQKLMLKAPAAASIPRVAVSFRTVQASGDPIIVLITHFGPGSSYPAGSVPSSAGGNPGDVVDRSASAASDLRARAIQAYEGGRRIVDTQTAQAQSSRRLADDWAAGAVSRSSTALAAVLSDLARMAPTSGLPGEAAIDNDIRHRVPEYLAPSTTRLEGKATERNLAALRESIDKGNFKDALERVRALRGSASGNRSVAANLAAITRADGTVDFSNVVVGLEPSPFSIGALPKAAAFRNRDAVIAVENEYEVLWADSLGLRTLSDSDRLAYLIGAVYVRAAADAGVNGLSMRSDQYLLVAANLQDGIRGFTVGMVQGLVDTAKLLPEIAMAAADISEAYFTSPERQRAALAALAVAIPRIPALVRVALAAAYEKFQRGDDFERGRILGRITFEVLIAVATGEALEYVKAAAAPADLARLSIVRRELTATVGILDGAAAEKAFATGVGRAAALDLPAGADTALRPLLARNPDAATNLVGVLQKLRVAGAPNADASWLGLVGRWGARDADAAEALSALIAAGTQGLGGTSVEEMLRAADGYAALKLSLPGAIVEVSKEVPVVRAIEAEIGAPPELKVLTEYMAFQRFDAQLTKVGRFQEYGARTWSTAVVGEGKNARVIAYNTAIEEFGETLAVRPFLLVERTVRVDRLLTLDPPTLARLGLSTQQVIIKNTSAGAYKDTLLISRIARSAGADAILAPSAADPAGASVLHILTEPMLK